MKKQNIHEVRINPLRVGFRAIESVIRFCFSLFENVTQVVVCDSHSIIGSSICASDFQFGRDYLAMEFEGLGLNDASSYSTSAVRCPSSVFPSFSSFPVFVSRGRGPNNKK